MLKKILLIIPAIAVISCSLNQNKSILYEGFNGNRLTVFITRFVPRENTPDQITETLMNSLNERAFTILACYVSLDIEQSKISATNDAILNKTIGETVSRGKIIKYSFNENGLCEAFAEYDISDFINTLNKINDN